MKTKKKVWLMTILMASVSIFLVESCKKDNTETKGGISYGSVTDQDGITYKTVKIGKQTWMAENLKTTKYTDGTVIPNVTAKSEWANTSDGAQCDYGNSASNNTTYGKLYNFYAVETSKLCPTGWRIPSENDFNILIDTLGGESIAGGKLKEIETAWSSPNAGATNSSGFSGLPGGERTQNGDFQSVGSYGNWWTKTKLDWNEKEYFALYYHIAETGYSGAMANTGKSVRCIKN